jgi:hypothetical protein
MSKVPQTARGSARPIWPDHPPPRTRGTTTRRSPSQSSSATQLPGDTLESDLYIACSHTGGASPTARGYWDLCACGMGIENIEARMKLLILEGVEPDYRNEAVQRQKEEAEWGRPRRRSPERGGRA